MVRPNVRWQPTNSELHEALGKRPYLEMVGWRSNALPWALIVIGALGLGWIVGGLVL